MVAAAPFPARRSHFPSLARPKLRARGKIHICLWPLAERSNHSGPSSLRRFDICASASNDEARFRQHLQIFTPAHAQNHGTEEIHSARLVKIAVDGTALGAFFTKSHNR